MSHEVYRSDARLNPKLGKSFVFLTIKRNSKEKTPGKTKDRQTKSPSNMMLIIQTIVVATGLLFLSVPCTQGSQSGLLRTKSLTDIDNRRLQTFSRISITESDLQNAVRELLGYSNNNNNIPMGWDNSMSMSMSMKYSSPTPTATPTHGHASLSPTASPSLRPTAGNGDGQEPTASPVVVLVIPDAIVKGTNSTGGVIGKEENTSRGRLSVAMIAGIILAGGFVMLVAALVTKKVVLRSAAAPVV